MSLWPRVGDSSTGGSGDMSGKTIPRAFVYVCVRAKRRGAGPEHLRIKKT